jgi:tetratricopeptide (TPR) repeat protein
VAKTPTKRSSAQRPQPDPAQIKAIERLLGTEDYPHAIARARALVARYPDHSGANRLLVDALYQGEGRAAATLAAYQWAERRPNSLAAHEALFQLAVEGRYFLLALRVESRMQQLGVITGDGPRTGEMIDELLEQPDGSRATREEQERFEIGKVHLEAHDFVGAARVLEGVDTTPARNNRALALFHLDRADAALTAFLDAWAHDRDNLFALSFALQLRLYRGDETGARGLAVPLAQAHARRAEDAQAQVAALLLLQENQAAWEAFERTSRADWTADQTGILEALRLLQGAGAASRLGRHKQARTLWEQALKQSPGLPAATANLAALKADGKPPTYPMIFDLGVVLPVAWVNGITTSGTTPLTVESRLSALTATDGYLDAIYRGGDDRVRMIAGLLLRHRLKFPHQASSTADPAARHAPLILRELARLPIGTKEERIGFFSALREHNLLGTDEIVQYWDGTSLQQIQMLATQIDREPGPIDLPDDLRPVLEQALSLLLGGRIEAAEACLNTILERVPEHPIALGNLAGIRSGQGRYQEVEAILRRIVAAHPDYLFARCNLAAIEIEAGHLDAAKALLDGLMQRPRLHVQEAFSLYSVMAMLNQVSGQGASADGLIATLERLVENELDERMLANAKARVAQVTAKKRRTTGFRSFFGLKD